MLELGADLILDTRRLDSGHLNPWNLDAWALDASTHIYAWTQDF